MAWLDARGFADRVIVPERSSATVEQAAEALGCEPAHIAKTMAFLVDAPFITGQVLGVNGGFVIT